jgi:predicted nucleic acid-binding protein
LTTVVVDTNILFSALLSADGRLCAEVDPKDTPFVALTIEPRPIAEQSRSAGSP